MIKFFRKIRQKLLNENKISKYLIYAIGEIVLVMIGILLALQVNNWNEAKKRNQIESQILTEILSNLDSDLKAMQSSIAVNKDIIDHDTKVLELLNNELPMTDSLRNSFALLYVRNPFTPNLVGYDNLKSVGINIIQNVKLKNMISELYGYRYPEFVDGVKGIADMVGERLFLEMSENIRYIEPLNIAEPIDLKTLRQNIQFKNALLNFRTSLTWSNGRYNHGKEEIEIVMQSIREELNK